MKARWSLRGIAVMIAMSALWGAAFARRNPERQALEAERVALEAELASKRAIAQDLDGHRRRQQARIAELEPVKKRMRPDLESILARLSAAGFEVSRAPTRVQGEYTRTEVDLDGKTIEELARAGVALEALPILRSDVGVRVRPSGAWTRSLLVFTHFALADTEPPPQPKARPWYAPLNDGLRSELAEKRAELATLELEIGDDNELRVSEDIRRVHDVLAGAAVDYGPLIRIGFTAPQPLLKYGTIAVSLDRQSVELSGARANPLVEAAVDPRWKLLAEVEGELLTTRWAWLGTKTATAAL